MSSLLLVSSWPALAPPMLAADIGGLLSLVIVIVIAVIAAWAESVKKQKDERLRREGQEQRRRRHAGDAPAHPGSHHRAAGAPDRFDALPGEWEPIDDAHGASPQPRTDARQRAHDTRHERYAEAQRQIEQLQRRRRDASPADRAGKPAEPDSTTPRHDPVARLGRLSHNELARAVMLAEVLGPPLALRDDPAAKDEGTPHRLV